MTDRIFIIMWDLTGLECVVDITEDEKTIVFETLQDKFECSVKLNHMIAMMLVRARVNSHRNYEIYTLQTSNISKEDLEGLFEDEPQMIVNLIREKNI